MGTIYKCSKAVRFTTNDNPAVVWDMKPGFIGEVPDWVEKDWYFKACCKDGIITALKSSRDRDIQIVTDKAPTGEIPEIGETKPPADENGKSNGRDGKKGKG